MVPGVFLSGGGFPGSDLKVPALQNLELLRKRGEHVSCAKAVHSVSNLNPSQAQPVSDMRRLLFWSSVLLLAVSTASAGLRGHLEVSQGQ
jgi:hypothetical protein